MRMTRRKALDWEDCRIWVLDRDLRQVRSKVIPVKREALQDKILNQVYRESNV
jgi:hypothetical protein